MQNSHESEPQPNKALVIASSSQCSQGRCANPLRPCYVCRKAFIPLVPGHHYRLKYQAKWVLVSRLLRTHLPWFFSLHRYPGTSGVKKIYSHGKVSTGL